MNAVNKGIEFTIPLSSLIKGLLSPTQWVFCTIIYSRNWEAMLQYSSAFGGFPRAELKDLGVRGYITYKNPDLGKEERDMVNNLLVTDKYTNLLYGTSDQGEVVDDTSLMIDDDEAFNDLFAAYPPYIDLGNGQKAPGRTMGFELGAERYSLSTKGKRSAHQHILSLLLWGKEHGLITMGLQKFIESKQWLSLEAAKESGQQGNISYDNTESI